MPKVTLTQPFSRFHGKTTVPGTGTGLVTFSNARAGNVVRQYVIPANPKSAQQIMSRGVFSAAAAAFKSLTTVEAANWNALAHLISKTNILGTDYTLTGIGLYCQVNAFRQLNGQSISDTVPTLTTMPIPVVGITSITQVTTTITVVANCTGIADGALVFVRLTPSIARQSRLLRRNELRIPSTTETQCFATVSSSAATAAITFNTVTVTAGQYCGVELTAMSSTYLPHAPQFWNQQLIA